MRYMVIFLCGISLLYAGGEAERKDDNNKLIIYAYDSFTSIWGLGPKIAKKFEAEEGISIEFISHGDALATFLAATNLDPDDGNRPDIILGIDNNIAPMAVESGLLREYAPPLMQSDYIATFEIEHQELLIPFDFGYLAFVYDSNKVEKPPTSLEDLSHRRFNKSIVLADPRTSSVGFAFLLWSVKQYGNNYLRYWERLRPSILTIADSWSTAYGLFTAGEAPIVLSYSTSPAYHYELENTEHIKASIFEDGNYLQVEYASITNYAQNPEGAERFIDFMLGHSFQSEVPKINIMYPVRNDIKMPEGFSLLQIPELPLLMKSDTILAHQEKWLDEWQELMSGLQ